MVLQVLTSCVQHDPSGNNNKIIKLKQQQNNEKLQYFMFANGHSISVSDLHHQIANNNKV